jgi:hypothetical protein
MVTARSQTTAAKEGEPAAARMLATATTPATTGTQATGRTPATGGTLATGEMPATGGMPSTAKTSTALEILFPLETPSRRIFLVSSFKLG